MIKTLARFGRARCRRAARRRSAPDAEPVTVIHAGTLLAEPGKAPRRNASVIVRGRTIAEVRDGFVDVPGARVVDLRTATVLPGLIDSHVHLARPRRPAAGAAPGSQPRQ